MPLPKKRAPSTGSKKPKRNSTARKARYSDSSFRAVVQNSFRAIGETTVKQALTLFHTLQDEDTPTAARATIIGALAYLILPADLIPDFLPVVGFTDDMGAIAAAAGTVASCIKPQHKRKAAKQARDLFS